MDSNVLMFLALWAVISALAVMRGFQLYQAVFGGLAAAGALLTLIVFFLPMPESRTNTASDAASFEHRLVVNPAGVQHHYFEGTHQPALDSNNPVPDVNRALQFLGLPSVSSAPTEMRRGHMTWDSYGEGRMTVYEVSCARGGGTCIRKVMVTPSRRDMMRNQAEASATKRFITADELGREWPFTVPFGIVSCRGVSEVYFIAADRTSYPANGTAMSAQPDGPDIRTIWLDSSPSAAVPGKVSMHRVIQAGLDLCP